MGTLFYLLVKKDWKCGQELRKNWYIQINQKLSAVGLKK